MICLIISSTNLGCLGVPELLLDFMLNLEYKGREFHRVGKEMIYLQGRLNTTMSKDIIFNRV